MLKIVIVAALATAIFGFPSFRDRFPNGYAVPNPCPEGGNWTAAGHFNESGGGPANPFGVDFLTEGFQWTVKLCNLDSDQDGKSNGEELGDPTCAWTPSNGFKVSAPTGHPGICEPLDAPACVNQQKVC
ncbi:temptin-like [Physella acuta]|uniref:temptin-like n=1 Tax=Physella acuta TaxID=109671 RepID=UPI0027DAFD1E|nr:temptin-like [Physella acuta]